MSKLLKLGILLSLLFFISGCWSQHELKDTGFILGWGMDAAGKNKYIGTAQIAVPIELGVSVSGGGKSGQPFVTLSAEGTSILDTAGNIQLKTSRFLFAGHRQNVFIGEKLARQGLTHIIDEYSRNPNVRTKTDIFVVKKGTAQEILQMKRPFGRVPVMEFNKLFSTLGEKELQSFLHLLKDASNPNSCPVLPAFQIEDAENNKQQPDISYAGSAVFDYDNKLVGYLSPPESFMRMWMLNQNKKVYTYTLPFDESKNPVSIDIKRMRATTHSSIKHGHIQFYCDLKAQGFVRENETSLNLSQPDILHKLDQELNKRLESDVQKLVKKNQTVFHTDVFRLGETLHRQHPIAWRDFKKTWKKDFPKVEISTTVEVTISRMGLTGRPAHKRGVISQ